MVTGTINFLPASHLLSPGQRIQPVKTMGSGTHKLKLNQIAARWPAKAVARFFYSYIKKQWKPSPKSSIVKSPQPTIKQDRHYHCL